MQFTTQGTQISWHRALQAALAGLLAVVLAGFVAGCGGAGANGEEDGDGDGGNGGDDPGTEAPAAPSGLSGESKDAAIDLTWETVDADDLDGYNVYRDTESIGDDVSGLDPQNGSPLSEASYPDDAVENGTTYYYVVTAVDTDGNESGPSGEVEKTPFDDPPSRPE